MLAPSLVAAGAPRVRANPAHAGGPVVRRVDVTARAGVLSADVRLDGVFTDDIVATLDSGLPVRLDVLVRLEDTRGRGGPAVRRRVTLTHDVWNDTWAIVRGDTTMTFASFDALRRATRTLRDVPLVRLRRLNPAREYVARVAVRVIPPGEDADDPLDALDVTAGDDESGGWRERMLDLGALLQRVLGRSDAARRVSPWRRSAAFRPDTLRERGRLVPGARGRAERAPIRLALARGSVTAEAAP